jgi:hypothetical protein
MIDKTVRLGTVAELVRGQNRQVDVFCRIEETVGRLSITGVVGPFSNGNCAGGCGQIVMSLKAEDVTPAPGWTSETIQRFLDTWRRWHLNDMQAGSAEQMAWLRANPRPEGVSDHYTWASEALAAAGLNPDASGYRYGHAWKREDVPAEVLAWLEALPNTDKTPAWI